MTNNDILKRMRAIFNMDDQKLMGIFQLADHRVSKGQINGWFKKEKEFGYVHMRDRELAIFLNGFISEKRGKKEGVQVVPENELNNNIILKKIKIALALKTEEVLDIFQMVEKPITSHELSGFLRNPKQEKFRPMLDQYLRYFFQGLRARYQKSNTSKQRN